MCGYAEKDLFAINKRWRRVCVSKISKSPLLFFINNSAMVVVEEPIYYASFFWPQRGAYTSTTWSLMPFSWSHLKNNDTHGLKQLLNVYILPLTPLLRYVDFLQSVPKWIFC